MAIFPRRIVALETLTGNTDLDLPANKRMSVRIYTFIMNNDHFIECLERQI